MSAEMVTGWIASVLWFLFFGLEACAILTPCQGLNPYPLHWKAKSSPLNHQGSLPVRVLYIEFLALISSHAKLILVPFPNQTAAQAQPLSMPFPPPGRSRLQLSHFAPFGGISFGKPSWTHRNPLLWVSIPLGLPRLSLPIKQLLEVWVWTLSTSIPKVLSLALSRSPAEVPGTQRSLLRSLPLEGITELDGLIRADPGLKKRQNAKSN